MPLRVRRRPDTGSLEIYGRVRPSGEKWGIRVRQVAGCNDPDLAREQAAMIERNIIRQHLLSGPHVVAPAKPAPLEEAVADQITEALSLLEPEARERVLLAVLAKDQS
jgi:hypothetical protein